MDSRHTGENKDRSVEQQPASSDTANAHRCLSEQIECCSGSRSRRTSSLSGRERDDSSSDSFQPSSFHEVRELFQETLEKTYERAMYLKCLSSEATLPIALPDRSLQPYESTLSFRPSRIHAGDKNHSEKSKSVRFTTSSLPPTSKLWSHDDADSTASVDDLLDERAEETKTISTIKSLLQ